MTRWLAVIVLLSAGAGALAAEPPFKLTDGCIVTPEKAVPQITEAAAELKTYLERLSGGEFEIVPGRPGEGAEIVFWVGRGKDFPQLGQADRLAALGAEAALVKTSKGRVMLLGSDHFGVTHAVMTFLKKLGCRWFFPGQDWEELPETGRVVVPVLDILHKSWLDQRRIWPNYGIRTEKMKKDHRLWQRHNYQGGYLTGSMGHAYFGIVRPKVYMKDHPEYFAMIAGERSAKGQLCTSNPEVRSIVARHAVSRFEKNPGLCMTSVGPNDGGGWCECADCKKVGTISDQTVALANVAAEAVAERFPDRFVGMYAYAGNSPPPNLKCHPNVIIGVATAFLRPGYTVDQLLDGWSRKADQIALRTYYGIYIWSHDQPSNIVDGMQKNMRSLRKRNIRQISAEATNAFAPRGLDYYVAAHLMWDTEIDVDALVEDFFERCWGPAARPMKKYYELWKGGGTVNSLSLPLAFEHLSRAADTARRMPDSPRAQRIRRRVDLFRMYAHWLMLWRENHAAKDSKEVKESFKRLAVFTWRLLETNMIHSYCHFRDRRPWNRPRHFSERLMNDWLGLKKFPKGKDLPAAPSAPDAVEDEPGLGLEEPEPERTDDKAWVPGSKLLPVSAEEIERLFQEDLAKLPEPVKVKAAAYSRKLVPLPDAAELAAQDAKSGNPWYRGGNSFVVLVPKAGAHIFHVTYAGRAGSPDKEGTRKTTEEYSIKRLGSEEIVARGIVEGPGQQEVSVTYPAAGLYHVRLSKLHYWWRQVSFGELRQVTVAARKETCYIITGTGPVYVWVPKGVKAWALNVRTGAGATITDPTGKVALQRGIGTAECYAVDVPRGLDGRVWSFALRTKGHFNLIGIPPYFSHRPERLLVPEEALSR